MSNDSRPGSPVTVMSWVVRRLRPYRGGCALLVGGFLVELAGYLALSVAFKTIFDGAIPHRDLTLLGRIVGLVAVGFGIMIGCSMMVATVTARISSSLIRELSMELFDRVCALPATFSQRDGVGDVLSCFSRDLIAIDQVLSSGIGKLVASAMMFSGCLVAVVFIEWRIAGMALLVLPLTLLGSNSLTARVARASQRRTERETRTTSFLDENLGAHAVVRAFGLEPIRKNEFGQLAADLALARREVTLASRLLAYWIQYGLDFVTTAVVAAGAASVILGYVSVGALVACCSILMNAGTAASAASDAYAECVRATSALTRIEQLLAAAPAVRDRPGGAGLGPLRREIQLNDVTFGHDEAAPTLTSVSLSIPAGSHVAFVGPSGSGKSTLVSLLMRFHEPLSGSITWDGTELRTASQASLRSHVGLVFQESVLFDASLRENIRLGRQDASDDEVERAAVAAGLLPEGFRNRYETPVGRRGGALSGGQRQRVAIARAIVRNPSVLILDEATSALDPETESRINEMIAQVGRGHTVITVTHRLESVRDADRIFVLKEGRVVEQGTMSELLAAGGVFRALYEKQSGFTRTREGQFQIEPERLRTLPLFTHLPGAFLERLAKTCFTERFETGERIVREGEAGDRMYIVVRGRLRVARGGRFLATLEDGDYFGEIALLQDVLRTASVQTLVPTVCLALTREQFNELLGAFPELAARMRDLAAERSATHAA